MICIDDMQCHIALSSECLLLSHHFTERDDLNPRKKLKKMMSSSEEEDSDSKEDDSSIEIVEDTSSKSKAKLDGALIKEDLHDEADNAKRAAKLAVKLKKKRKKMHEGGKNNRRKPSDADLADVIDTLTGKTDKNAEGLAKAVADLSEVIPKAFRASQLQASQLQAIQFSTILQATQRHNTPPSSPAKNLKTCQELLSSLLVQKSTINKEEDPELFADVKARIEKYNSSAKKLDEEFFAKLGPK